MFYLFICNHLQNYDYFLNSPNFLYKKTQNIPPLMDYYGMTQIFDLIADGKGH